MNERPSDDSTSVARAVEEIEGASFIFAVVLVLGPVWSLVVPFAGWGFLTWTVGAAVWCFLVFLAVRNVQSLPCPRCGRPWRPPFDHMPRRVWPTQRRCGVCGFGLDDYDVVPSRPDTVDPRGPKGSVR